MISVCIATYNGVRYLEEELKSILPQLNEEDEMIISDDGSTDGTVELIQQYIEQDARIKLFKGPGAGLIKNFEHAIQQSSGEIIFLADQDDIWMPKKVQKTVDFFNSHPEINLTVSDLMIVNEKLELIQPSYFLYKNVRLGFYKNIFRNSFIGAGMSFRNKMKAIFLPIPEKVPMHDMWFGLMAEKNKSAALIPEPLTLYRRHSENASELNTKTTKWQQLKWRWNLMLSILQKNKKR